MGFSGLVLFVCVGIVCLMLYMCFLLDFFSLVFRFGGLVCRFFLVLVGLSGLVLFRCVEFVRWLLFMCSLSYSSFLALLLVYSIIFLSLFSMVVVGWLYVFSMFLCCSF